MEHPGALAALEPYLALSKSASGPRAAADLVTRATSDPNTFFFAELLHTPQIQALASSPDHEPFLRLLHIFSYGLYQDLLAPPPDHLPPLPPLCPQQTLKLRQLSLVSLASDRSNLSYPALQQALDLPSPRDVEDLAITAVYAGLLRATLDPARQVLSVTSISPVRDIAPGAVPSLIAALDSWAARCFDTLRDLEAQSAAIRDAAAIRDRDQRIRRDTQDHMVAVMREADRRSSPMGSHDRMSAHAPYMREALSRRAGLNKRSMLDSVSAAGDDSMDIDEPHAAADDKSKRASKRKM